MSFLLCPSFIQADCRTEKKQLVQIAEKYGNTYNIKKISAFVDKSSFKKISFEGKVKPLVTCIDTKCSNADEN